MIWVSNMTLETHNSLLERSMTDKVRIIIIMVVDIIIVIVKIVTTFI